MGSEDVSDIVKRLVGLIGGGKNERNIDMAKQIISEAIELALKELRYTRICLLARPDRADCESSVGVRTGREKNELEKALSCITHIEDIITDESGRPPGWCEVCWRGYLLKYEKATQM